MGLKFQNPKFYISCKVSFYIFFAIKCEPFRAKSSMRPFQSS